MEGRWENEDWFHWFLSELALVFLGVSSCNTMQYPHIWQTFSYERRWGGRTPYEHLVGSRHSSLGIQNWTRHSVGSAKDYIPEEITLNRVLRNKEEFIREAVAWSGAWLCVTANSDGHSRVSCASFTILCTLSPGAFSDTPYLLTVRRWLSILFLRGKGNTIYEILQFLSVITLPCLPIPTSLSPLIGKCTDPSCLM